MMPKERTSRRVASAAGRLLARKRNVEAAFVGLNLAVKKLNAEVADLFDEAFSAAGSALTQAPDKRRNRASATE